MTAFEGIFTTMNGNIEDTPVGCHCTKAQRKAMDNADRFMNDISTLTDSFKDIGLIGMMLLPTMSDDYVNTVKGRAGVTSLATVIQTYAGEVEREAGKLAAVLSKFDNAPSGGIKAAFDEDATPNIKATLSAILDMLVLMCIRLEKTYADCEEVVASWEVEG